MISFGRFGKKQKRKDNKQGFISVYYKYSETKNKNMSRIRISIVLLVCILSAVTVANAKENANSTKNEFNPISTGVTSLSIAPDARAAAMGDLGAATDPDVNSQYWNPAKYAFAYSQAGVSLSYTPWLRKLVNDIFLADVAGYWKLGSSDLQALSASLRYFSLGEIITNDTEGNATGSINPYEMAFDLGYSRKLSEKFSMGVVFRYIYSDLGFHYDGSSASDASGASAFSADIAGYYTTYPIIGRNECQWSWGFNISNIGTKISYDSGNNNAFLPTNLRLGTSFLFPIAEYNTISLNLDLNKLLVPTRPQRSDYESDEAFDVAEDEYQAMSPIKGIFKSFSDAPGGFKEDLREINFSIGAEYSYNQQFFIRAGYFNENKFKGNRKFFSFGAGFSLNVLRIDAAYMVATAQTSPLDQTLRFTLSFDMDGLRDLIGHRR